jgi:DNA-binding NarL/FixJ family response regulator
MLFGVHVYARAKVVPDIALSRGEDAYRTAKLQGDRAIEFLAAGGVALTLLELGDLPGAEQWVAKAAAAASMAPTRTRARHLETWRGMIRAGAGDTPAAIRHLEQAVSIATEAGPTSARCETLAGLAMTAATLVARDASDAALAELVGRSAAQVHELRALLPGHAAWGAQADAALATIALVRGDVEQAVMAGGAALSALQAGLHEDASLDIVIPAARAVFAGAPPEVQDGVRTHLQLSLSRIARGIDDEGIRVRWLTGPVGRQLVELAGSVEGTSTTEVGQGAPSDAASTLDDTERRLLQLLTEGRTNAEIAAELDLHEGDVDQRLARLQARLGASSRAEATSLAFRGLAAVGSL